MVELPADIREALERSRAGVEPSADDRARVASALALRLGMPEADWTGSPPSAAKPVAWIAKLLAGAGAVGLATTLFVALPALRQLGVHSEREHGGRAALGVSPELRDERANPVAPEASADGVTDGALAGLPARGEEPPPSAAAPGERTPRSSNAALGTARAGLHGERNPSRAPSMLAGNASLSPARVPAYEPIAHARDHHARGSLAALSTTASAQESSREPTPTLASEYPASPSPSAAAAIPARASEHRVSPPPSAATLSAREATLSADASHPEPRASDLARELALLRGAARALDRAQPDAALQLLDRHARDFAGGSLRDEREALRVSTLCRLGRADEARALRTKLGPELTRSPLRARIEHDCAAMPAEH